MNKNSLSGLIPWKDLRHILSGIEKPGRYVGGEFGTVSSLPESDDYRICIVFPDLYEIAMSNQAVRILYKLFNDSPGFHAERAFSPAPDFKDALKDAGVDLYSLENGLPVGGFDLLAVTIGYELSFTNLLSFLESSGIPLDRNQRDDTHPLVLAGGPAMTNPAPWADYLDGVFIGEAEGTIIQTLNELKKLKQEGASRSRLQELLDNDKFIWTPGNPVAIRAQWPGFGMETSEPAAFPVPSMPPVQDHGVIEIMRGCPNKCRFCHAGVFYRPFRQKPIQRILNETEYLVNDCGYRDITLSSLSTGDYNGLEPLVKALNKKYAHRKVSFSLPSLRVNSVTLSLIGSLGEVRKSGLTFAVETPTVEGQQGINKEVPADKVVAILKEAKSSGWKLAKFYFMLGLPVAQGNDEEQNIIDYLLEVQAETGMNLNVNLGTFIPKPHTPFERSAQLTDEEAIGRIRKIREGLRVNKKIRYSFHSPYVSFLEGILSRGDERAGRLARIAWEKGAGFDAWDDRMDKEAWRSAIDEADWDVEGEICRGRGADEILPWHEINLGVTAAHLAKETKRSVDSELTVPCDVICTDHCGVCDKDCKAVVADIIDIPESLLEQPQADDSEPEWRRLLIRFAKTGPAVYLGHLDIMNVFEKALQRSGIIIDFTRGFNPKPRIEFAQPLSLGLASTGEIGTVKVISTEDDAADLCRRLQKTLPQGIEILETSWIGSVPEGRKVIKVMGAFWGSDWIIARDNHNTMQTENSGPESAMILSEAISNICKESGIPDDCSITVSDDDSVLNLRLRHGGTRHHNLMKILEQAMNMKPLESQWIITRKESLAKGKTGEAVSYGRAFPEVYEF